MDTHAHASTRADARSTGRTSRWTQSRNESGQAMAIVVVLIVMLAVLTSVMVGPITSDTQSLVVSTNQHAALAAAEAGIQWYRDNLDSYSAYYSYCVPGPESPNCLANNNPLNDAALSSYCGAKLSSTCDLSGTSPAEAFHYAPNPSSGCTPANLGSGQVCTVVLSVTGRAGSTGNYSYIYVETTFTSSPLLDDVYFSDVEVLDPTSQTVQGINVSVQPTAGGAPTDVPETSEPVSYSYTNSAGTTVQVPPSGSPDPNLWQAACEYDTYSPNNFVDTLGLTIGETTYSTTNPYYGPYFDNSGFSYNINASGGVVTSGARSTVTVPGDPCESPYDFVTGEVFNGPVYTNDQLHVCGSPTFEGAPSSLTSGAPSNVPYLPLGSGPSGSVEVTAANSGSNGPYPTNLIGDYVPAGYTTDALNCSGSTDDPTLEHGVALNGDQSLPSENTNLANYGTASPPNEIGYGCTYVGPTMIEITGTTMNVWSPLSTNAATTTPLCSNDSTFSASQPLITGIALPTDGVVYVQNYVPQSTAPPVPSDGSNDGSTECFNPYQQAMPPNSAQCLEGDVYIEGELNGQLTIGSAANIIITRDITYSCVDNGGAASGSNPVSVSACTNAVAPNVLGLSAKYDVLISGNEPTSSNPLENPEPCVANGFGDGTSATAVTATVKINGTSYSTSIDPPAIWPTVCDPQNVIIDASIFALNGSFGVENWSTTPYSDAGDANLNGADLSFFRGPFGIDGDDGYIKQFSFDARLAYLSSPHILVDPLPIWQSSTYVACPNTSCPPIG
jgi:hypothetical protein